MSADDHWTINSSYLQGTDKEFGWGNRSYFTFYSQFRRQNYTVWVVTETICLVLLLVGAFTGNVVVLVSLCQSKGLKRTTHCFIGNLAVAGLLLTTTIPMVLVTRIRQTWVFGQAGCSLINYAGYAGAALTIWTLTLISIDRRQGTTHRTPLLLASGARLSVVMWVVVLLASIPMGIFFITKDFSLDGARVTICTLVWPFNKSVRISVIFTIPSVLLLFLLPCGILVFNYFQILRILIYTRNNLHRHQNERSPSTMRRYKAQKSHNRKELKVVRILILIVVLFCVMWLPLAACFILILYDGISDHHLMTSQAFLAGACFTMANASVNPFLYGYVNEKYTIGCNAICWRMRIRCRKRKRRVRISPIPVVYTIHPPPPEPVQQRQEGNR